MGEQQSDPHLPSIVLTGLPAEGKLRGDFTYKLIQDVELSDVALEHSLWAGAVLRNCKFTDINFARSDFAGTRFVDCEFTRCNFEPDEFRSCFLTRVTFNDCIFAAIQCVATEFDDCAFIACDMRRSALRECQFRRCRLQQLVFTGSSVTLNRFDESQFDRVALGDATIQFLTFNTCIFDHCSINAETLGYTFGLTLAALEGFDLIYLGAPQEHPAGMDLLTVLLDTYRARRWALGACMLELNLGIEPTFLALRKFARHLARDVAAEPRLDWDELLFLCFVVEDLASSSKLPFLAAWELNGTVSEAMQAVEKSRTGFEGLVPPAANVGWRLNRLAQRRLADILRIVNAISPDKTLTLSIVLQSRPSSPLDKAIPTGILAIVNALPTDFYLIREFSGSWNEVWQISGGILLSLKLSLVLIDSTWEQAAKVWTRTKAAGRTIKGLMRRQTAPQPQDLEALPAPGVAMPSLDLSSVAAAVERATAELRVITESDREALLRLDIAVRRLALLGDSDVRRLLEYGAPNLDRLNIGSVRGQRHRSRAANDKARPTRSRRAEAS